MDCKLRPMDSPPTAKPCVNNLLCLWSLCVCKLQIKLVKAQKTLRVKRVTKLSTKPCNRIGVGQCNTSF
jgi:hypothetical protein